MHPLAHRTLALTLLIAAACSPGDADHAPESTALGLSFASEIAADAPAVYFKLSETSGTVAFDSSGNGRNGTFVGGVALGQRGALADTANTAALFDGVDDRVDISDSPSLRLDGSFSIEFFAKSSGSVVNGFPGILGKGNAESGTGYLVYYNSAQRPVFKRASIDGCRVSKRGR